MLLTIITTITFLLMLTTNYLSNSIPIGGRTQSDISAEYPTLFTPSGFTFSIWGIIYILLIVFVILLFTDSTVISANRTPILLLFSLVNILNSVWLVFWHTDRIFLSTIVMIALLTSLLVMLSLISKSDSFTFATFSIYAGWISVATVATVAIFLVKQNYPLFMNHEQLFFGITLFLTVLIGAYMLINEQNYYFAGVFLWAYIGIATKFIP